MNIDVENELNGCVTSIGGQLVSNLVGESPTFNDADYLLDQNEIVVELKILTVDQMHEPGTREKMTNIHREASARGETRTIAYGESMITAGDQSPEYKCEFRVTLWKLKSRETARNSLGIR